MIRLDLIQVRGVSTGGEFAGSLPFMSGLQIVSAHNGYGKSLASTSIAWCLGLEPIFGSQDNDPSKFPLAVRDEIELDGHTYRVESAEAELQLSHIDGRRLELVRKIKGADMSTVEVREFAPGASDARVSRLAFGRGTMKNQASGFQAFFFQWMAWPRAEVATYRGPASEIYLENLAPLFFIDQNEGWTAIQALQIKRYGQQQIADVAIDYLLGDLQAIETRFARLNSERNEQELRVRAQDLETSIRAFFLRRGWTVEWTSHGTLEDVARRWSKTDLRGALLRDAKVDLAATKQLYSEQEQQLRARLAHRNVQRETRTVSAEASQKVIELKERLHETSESLRDARRQRQQAEELHESIDHRIHAAEDVLRLKQSGVGRFDHLVECPTCHREVEPSTFELQSQGPDAVSQHIAALKRDRSLIQQNLVATSQAVLRTESGLKDLETEYSEARRALALVTSATDSISEVLVQATNELSNVLAKLDRLDDTITQMRELQEQVSSWSQTAQAVHRALNMPIAISARRQSFVGHLWTYLLALGHSGLKHATPQDLRLEESVPYLGYRRLSSLGSASDQPRLVAAFALALAAASTSELKGFHPGFVFLDEPLQQNPDEEHRQLFIDFLTQTLAHTTTFQTIIFTSLSGDEVAHLEAHKTNVLLPTDVNLLRRPAPAAQSLDKGEPEIN